MRDNGDFEVIISANARRQLVADAAGDEGHHHRQYFYDWDAEDPYHLSIERIDVHGPGPVTEPVTVTAQVESVGRFVDGFAEYWRRVQPARRRPQTCCAPSRR